MGHPWGLVALVLVIGEAAQAQSALSISLQSGNFNGYQVACFGKQTGTINATVSGGTAPYQFSWSNGASTEDLSGLPAGYYMLTVLDADSAVATADITLTEPTPLVLVAEPYTYPNGYNVSCYDCYNGSIDVTVGQGVPPYTYLWNDSITTTQDRNGLGGKKFFVVVRDANQCWVKSETMMLTQPERGTWSKNGDGGTNPSSQYIGTSDEKDVVFKSNGQERLRLKADGSIGLWGADTTAGMLYRDFDGKLKIGGGPTWPTLPEIPCAYGFEHTSPIWFTAGNAIPHLCPGVVPPRLGTLGNSPVEIITNGQLRVHFNDDNGGMQFYGQDSTLAMEIFPNGKMGIGTLPPPGAIGNYRLYVEDGIATRDVLVKLGDWPDYVFSKEHLLKPLPELREYIAEHRHLPGIPSAAELEEQGGVELGDIQRRMLKVVEEQALYILQLEQKQAALEQRLNALEAEHR